MPKDTDATTTPRIDVCPQCAATVTEGQRFCVICGTELACPNCGTRITKGHRFCKSCGQAFVQSRVGDSAEGGPEHTWTTPVLVIDRLGRYTVTDTPRALQLSLGIALRDAQRFKDSVAAMQRALEEEGTEPSAGDILLHVADVHTRAGAPAEAAQAYWSAVLASPDWADEILPFLISALTPQLAATLASSTPSNWDTKFADMGIDPADRLHAGFFWTLVLLYSGSFEQAQRTLAAVRERDPQAFRTLAPQVLGDDTLRAAAESLASGEGFFEVAKVARALQLPQALAFVEKALELGIKGDSYPEAPVHRWRGELLEAAGRLEEAAAAYHEAGQRYLWRQELTTAIDLLERATRLRPGHAGAYWHLMDAYRSRSYIETPPYADRASAEAARAAWDAGTRIAPPAADASWAYCSRALLNEQLARFVAGGAEQELYWESVALLERAALNDEKNAFAYAYLGRFHRYLLNGACADQATRRAVEVDEKDLAALEERAAALSDAGEAPRALEIIAKRRDVDSKAGAWFDALEAFNLVCTGPYDRMLELLNKALDADPKNIWYRVLRATCYRLLDRWTEAAEDSAKVWSGFDSADLVNRSSYAWAAYRLGQFDAAIALFQPRLTSPLEAADAHQGLGMCALAIGDIPTAREHLRAHIAMVNTARELDEWLIDGARTARRFAKDVTHQAAIDALVAELRGPIETRRGELKARSPEEELRTALEGQRVLETIGSSTAHRPWAWIGAHAALARLHRETSDWTRVSVEYEALLPEIDRFPEATLGLQKTFDGLIEAGATALAGDDAKTGLAPLVEAARLERSVRLTVASQTRSRLRALSAVAAALTSDKDDARAATHQALDAYRSADNDLVTRFVATCRPVLRVPSTFWRVADRWRMLAEDHAASEYRADLLAIVDGLQASCLQDAFALVDTAPAVERLPIVTPIVLEIGTTLVPFVDNAQDGGKFLFEMIPAMRQRIEATLGIKVTGVRARPYATTHSDAYRVQIEEVVVAEGQAPMEDAPTFLIDTLESVLRAHAELFLGVEESEELVAIWEKTPEGQSLSPELLGSPGSRLRFKRLLRTLSGERIPLTRPDLILGAVRKTGLEDTESALHAIRVALAPVRFDKHDVRAMAVPAEWHRWVSTDQGRTSTIATPVETVHAMATIRRWLAAPEPPQALVADTPPLAALVRRIVTGEFPDLVVLTRDEVTAAATIRLPDAAPAGFGEGMHSAGA